MASNQTIQAVLKTIRAAYPGRFEIAEDSVKVWASFVQDIDDELLYAAVARFVSSADHAFPPSIPEIRRAATDIRSEVIGVPTAWEAWAEVLKAPLPSTVRPFRDGAFHEPDEYQWSHEIVGKVARQLGWHRRQFPGTNLEADRAHWVRAYDSAVQKMLKAETQLPLVTQYIAGQQQKLFDVTDQVKQLTEKRTV